MITVSAPPVNLAVADAVDALPTGQIAPTRMFDHDTIAGASQIIFLTYFTADRTELVSNIAVSTRATGAGATPTLCRMGIYSEAASGDLALAGACANDTALFSASNTVYTRALSAPFTRVAGQRYAAALLVVTAAALPNFCGWQAQAVTFANGHNGIVPRRIAVVLGQSDLPANVATGSVAGNGSAISFHITA